MSQSATSFTCVRDMEPSRRLRKSCAASVDLTIKLKGGLTVITEENVNEAFDNYLIAFNILADKEDELERMKLEVEDFKEGSPKHTEAIRKAREFELAMSAYQREFRRAGLQLDRVKTLANMQKK